MYVHNIYMYVRMCIYLCIYLYLYVLQNLRKYKFVYLDIYIYIILSKQTYTSTHIVYVLEV